MRLLLFAVLFLCSCQLFAQKPLLSHGHSHNDYTHRKPLQDALAQGMFSVEADIHLVNGELKVGHTCLFIKGKKTLTELYLQPLKQIVTANNGTVYKDGPKEFVLMIDIKTDATATYKALKQELLKFSGILTSYSNGIKYPGAVKVLISGSKDEALILSDSVRFAALDGNLEQVASGYDSHEMPRISGKFREVIKWRGSGKLKSEERAKLIELAEQGDLYGRKVRLYAGPNRRKVWHELMEAGIHWINVDKLGRFRKFVLKNRNMAIEP